MPRIRVLVVDDAVVFRRLVSDELSADPALEVVGTAANGKIALAKLTQVNPDVVILDVEMPEMDGLATLREIRKSHPRLPVVMFSALTERGAEVTLDALSLGATGYFPKPFGTRGMTDSLRVIRTDLIPQIKALCARTTPAPAGPASSRRIAGGSHCGRLDAVPVSNSTGIRSPASPPPARIDVVAVAASTGGPNALTDVLGALPADLPVPVVVVQHMPPTFTRLLADRLNARGPLRVQEGRAGEHLAPGCVWIAPGDFHMSTVGDGGQVRLLVHQGVPENSCRPAADVLFRSVARSFGANVLAVVLTGMGQDGLRGCEVVKEAGGQVIVQDEETSVVWGMPGFVSRAGLADKVLPLPQVALEIVRRARAVRGDGR